jgi:dTDP-6-deoxy-L-talose 4-dehydrogenase [NAD(P)+]
VAAQLSAAADRGTAAEPRSAPLCAHRDVVDVRDVAEAVLAAAERPVAGRVFTLGCSPSAVGRDRAVGVRAGWSTA